MFKLLKYFELKQDYEDLKKEYFELQKNYAIILNANSKMKSDRKSLLKKIEKLKRAMINSHCRKKRGR